MESWCMGAKIYPALEQSKLFFELDTLFAELKLKNWKLYIIDIILNLMMNLTYSGPLSQVTGKKFDRRSDDVESQNAIDLNMTDIWEEKCD